MTNGDDPTVECLHEAAAAIARRIHPALVTSVLDRDDLRQEALAAALEAQRKATGTHGMHYYTRVMENRVFDVLRAFDPLSQSARRDLRALEDAETKLMQQLGATYVSPDVVAEYAGISPRRARAVRRLAHESATLRVEIKDATFTSPTTPCGEDAVLESEAAAAFVDAFKSLDPRDQDVIRLTLFHQEQSVSYTDIGKALGVSRQRARTLSQRAVKRLYSAYIIKTGGDCAASRDNHSGRSAAE